MRDNNMKEQNLVNNSKYIDYKNTEILKKFLNPNGRILARKRTGLSDKKQKKLEKSIKRARFMGLLPFIVNK